VRALVFFVAFAGSAASDAVAQMILAGGDTADVEADSSDAVGQARAAQARYERARERTFPLTFANAGGPCDEVVGRLCTWFGEGEWIPEPEGDEARALREGLIGELDRLQALAPGDGWILGQRVWQRAEGGDWGGALEVARACGRAERWWCLALEGLALHGLGRVTVAEAVFEDALEALEVVDSARARRWRVPERAVDDEARSWLRGLEREGSDALAEGLGRLWTLADPLYLVDGNDRRTAHAARWTVATLKDRARNPFRISWGRDLEELTVRHGWEVGWERTAATVPGGTSGVIGHRHPEGREYMPSGRALASPSEVTAEAFLADRRRPRSLHTPAYAPTLLPMETQLVVFPREGRSVVMATAALPEDTSYHARHEHPRPWTEPGDQAELPDVRGLFAVPLDGARPLARAVEAGADGALWLEVPPGRYVISVESWSPSRMRAGRTRLGVELAEPIPDVATLSDLLLLDGARGTPASLEEALPLVLRTDRLEGSERLAVAWEVSGLGLRPETLRFSLAVERTDRGVFRRLGELLGISERPPTLDLSWEEPGPPRPGTQFFALELDLPELDPGRYDIRVTLATEGRSDVVARRSFTVEEP